MTTPLRFSFARRVRRLGLAWPTVLAVLIGVAAYVTATTSSEERVAQLWIAATVLEDGGAEVVEVIDYDFGTATDRHGIFRDIPDLRTSDPVRVSSPTAPDSVSRTELSGSVTQLRIGDPDETVTGLHRYVLRYTLDDVAQNGRIAWDAVGTEWDVPIEDVEVHVLAPATLARLTCTTGSSGSTDSCAVAAEDPGHLVASVGLLDPGKGVTVTAPLGEALDTAPAVPEPDPVADSTGVGALALAVVAGLLAVLAGLGTKRVLRRADRHHAPRLGLPGRAPGEQTRVDTAELASLATPSSRLPSDLTPSQGAILLANSGVNLWGMADWVAEQAAAGSIGLEAPDEDSDGDEAKKSVVLVRRQDGEGFAQVVLDEAFDGRQRLTLGRYDSQFARASTLVKEHLIAWRESSALWDQALARRARLARRLGLVAGLGGIALAVIGASLASTAGTAALLLTGAGAALGVAGFCVKYSFWGEKVLTPEGTAAWLQVESLRLYLTRSDPDDDDLPTDRFGEYTAWAVALSATEEWARLASRITDTTRAPVQPVSTDTTGVLDQFYWIRHANIGMALTTSCAATTHQPRVASSASSSGGSSYSGGYSSSSSSSVGSGSGGGGGGSW
jgi:uncharacterized membrane protein YgcG